MLDANSEKAIPEQAASITASGLSLKQSRHRAWAVRETIIFSLVALFFVFFDKYEFLFFSTLISPILLFRSKESILAGIEAFDFYLEIKNEPSLLAIKFWLATFLATLVSCVITATIALLMPFNQVIFPVFGSESLGYLISLPVFFLGWFTGVLSLSAASAVSIGYILGQHKSHIYRVVMSFFIILGVNVVILSASSSSSGVKYWSFISGLMLSVMSFFRESRYGED